MKIERIDIQEKEQKAFATFTDGQRLPMHYTSAETMFNRLFHKNCRFHKIVNNHEVIDISGNDITIVKTYKDFIPTYQ